MRKPRDYDAELKALEAKAQRLAARKVEQLGNLVIATRADTLPVELLAGALLAAVESKDSIAREAWSARGAAFFQRPQNRTGSTAQVEAGSREHSQPPASPAAEDRS